VATAEHWETGTIALGLGRPVGLWVKNHWI